MRVRRGVRAWVVGVCVALASPGIVHAQRGGGPPEGRGGGDPEGHSRRPDGPRGSQDLGSLYGDQWVIVRDVSPVGDGAPVAFRWLWPNEAYTPDGDFGPSAGTLPLAWQVLVETNPGTWEVQTTQEVDPAVDVDTYAFANDQTLGGPCGQPVSLAAPVGVSEENQDLYLWAYVDAYGATVDRWLLPLDPECSVPTFADGSAAPWAGQEQEVDFGRLSVARSPQDVIDAALAEATATLASGTVDLDPAGRLRVTNADGVKTIDAPLENLALYQTLMETGCIAGVSFPGALAHLGCDGTARDDADLRRAASLLAGAADKTGALGVDLVVYTNAILGIGQDDDLATMEFVDFGGFRYVRGQEPREAPQLLVRTGPTSYVVGTVYLFNAGVVFTGGWGPNLDYPVVNFVRAADDDLSVIEYIHNYALPVQIDPVP